MSQLTDIPVNQLKGMMAEQWWADTIQQVRREENDQITAKMTSVVEKSIESVLDRIEHGDSVLNLKTGELKRVPVKLKDVTNLISNFIDKRNLLRGEATTRSERLGQDDILKDLGSKFEAFAKKLGVKPVDVIDVTPVEEKIEDVRS